MKELKNGVQYIRNVCNSGARLKYAEEKCPHIGEEVCKIVDGSTYGNPERILSYTTEV